jgi:beta-galactosidase
VSATPPTLTHVDGRLHRHGVPHQIVSGSIHYFRVHPDQWADRIARLAAMGVNTLDTYIPWNWHERVRGSRDFTGARNVVRFVELAADRGLDVILRPGPYICAEWDNGGLPAWLTGDGAILRSSDPRFTEPVGSWFDELLPLLTPLQTNNGGPVVAWQVENEYGSYADDQGYMRWVRDALTSRGVTELLYTADGATHLMQDGGALPNTLAAATFGSDPAEAFALLDDRRPGHPHLCAEYWNGWFDHLSERHHTRDPESVAQDVSSVLAGGDSMSLYMAHGGTNFGLWSGSNHDGVLQPTITSYDSDAPIAEDGTLTPKFSAIRDAISTSLGTSSPEPPPAPSIVTPLIGAMHDVGGLDPLFHALGWPHEGRSPATFEVLGLPSGLVRYTANPILPPATTRLHLDGLRDRATVLVDGVVVGATDVLSGTDTAWVDIVGDGERHRLDVLVEAWGHVNYGPLTGEAKGLLSAPRLERRRVDGWRCCGVDLEGTSLKHLLRAAAGTDVKEAPAVGHGKPLGGRFFQAEIHAQSAVPASGGAHLELPGWGSGYVWVGSTLLGRYDSRAPQRTYYVPGPLLRDGETTLTLLEMRAPGETPVFRDCADLGETEQYVEVFDTAV